MIEIKMKFICDNKNCRNYIISVNTYESNENINFDVEQCIRRIQLDNKWLYTTDDKLYCHTCANTIYKNK